MNITVEQGQGRIPITVLGLHGNLDASSYLEVIAKAKEVYSAGAENILIDMSEVPFMASSGLAALHSIAVLVRGEEPPDPEYGWAAFHALEQDRDSGLQKQVKLLNPQPQVDRTLELSGLKVFFEIYTDKETALNSF